MEFLRKTRFLVFLSAGAFAAAALWAGFHFAGPSLVLLRGGGGLRISSGTFTRNLDAVLAGQNFDEAQRHAISKAFPGELNLRRLKPEDAYAIAITTAGAFKYIRITRDLKHYFVSAENEGYSGRVEEIRLSSRMARVDGGITSSLWESLSAQNVPPDLILDYADIFSWSVDFLTEVRSGDTYALAWEYREDPLGRIVSKRILAAVYDGAETGKKSAAYFKGKYYDEDGNAVQSMFLRAPLHYRRISSHFTYKRFHPVLKYMRPHLGIDYAAQAGTPVSAVADGRVVYAGWKGANGRLVILRHGSGYESTYGHLSRYARGVKNGRRVRQGEVVGYVGSSGLSSGPHLDFRVKLNGRPLNFLKMKYRSSGSLAGKEKEELKALLKKFLP